MTQARNDSMTELLANLDRGESLPARWYTDPAIAEREITRIFRKSWIYVGPVVHLANLGDYITGYAGGVPVVVVRDDAGLAGFVNVCRHRRHEVMKGRGNARTMMCGYHAWTYDLAGQLKRAPRSESAADFRLEDFPLLPIRAEALGPLVFVNLDREAPPVRSLFGPVLDIIARSGVVLDELKPHSRAEAQSPANWKAMLENYLECYHCAVAHPGFSAAIDVRPDQYKYEAHAWFSTQIGPVKQSALAGRGKAPPYDVAGAVGESQYHFLWPNLTISINPGFPNLSAELWVPDGPTVTRGFSDRFFGRGVSDDFVRTMIAFNDQVAAEDERLTDSVQRGLAGGLPDHGRFLPDAEPLVLDFQRKIIRAMAGEN
ncbi:MAG: aromatic ring-hydroxylating dioxygenase subunit alpha [Reyranellaceae bacterium]